MISNRFFRFSSSIAAIALFICACTTTSDNMPVSAVNHPSEVYGLTKEEAVEVCMPEGQHQYLARLICPDGQAPTFYRVGNFGIRNSLDMDEYTELTPQQQRELELRIMDSNRILQAGEIDIHIVDGYEVDCHDHKVMLYLDMYHCAQPVPQYAPAGFGLRR